MRWEEIEAAFVEEEASSRQLMHMQRRARADVRDASTRVEVIKKKLASCGRAKAQKAAR